MKVSWPHVAVAAFAVTLVSLPAVAQTAGPGGAYFGAASGPQSGNQPAAATATAQPAKRALYNSTSPSVAPAGSNAGPSGAYFGAASGPQSGAQPAATTESRGRSASNAVQQPGSAGPSGNNFGSTSNPQTGR
jgi:hypothetical protein